MQHKIFTTNLGDIHYWINSYSKDRPTLVFLPGLTADHRLFDKQIEYFKDKCNVFVWDAPGHALSRPFEFDFSLMDKARWVHDILAYEGIGKVIIIGQSMGGYVAQVFAELFPDDLIGFVSIDSAPLQRKYLTSIELWLLKRMEPVYRHYPWKSLVKTAVKNIAMTEYGRYLMNEFMMTYADDQNYYAKLAGHGYKILAEAIEADLKYKLPEHTLLICGTKDKAGSCIRYSKAWHKNTGYRLEWIEGAGHNSNTDAPDKVNELIERLNSKFGSFI